ncbi:MAG: peptidylprolyl isomerase [Bacteroidales bacterium]|nr:peptidylprolyl isomerase [Bacteroidales bacterium]
MKNRNTFFPSFLKVPALFAFLVTLSSSWSVDAQIVGTNDTLILDRVVAIVGKYPILHSEVGNLIKNYRDDGRMIPGDSYCFALESILVNKLLVNQAEIDSVEVTDDEVERNLDYKLQYFIYRKGSQENLEKDYKKPLLEIKKDLFQPQKDQMLADKMKSQITDKVVITPSEVQKFYKQLPSAQIPLRPTVMEIREISLDPKITEEEIVRVQNRLKEFRDRIQKGESFTTLAVLYSEDAGTAPLGGKMEMTPRSSLVPEFAAVAFNLKGQEISRVVKTEFGYHIIQLIDRRGDMISVRHILLSPKPSIEEKASVRKRLDSIAQVIRENKISFEDAAVKFSSAKDTRANGGLLVNKGNEQYQDTGNANTTWFEPEEMDPAVFNAIKNLKIGELSGVVETKDDKNHTSYKIFTIKSKKVAHKADLKQDYQFLQTLALADKNAKKMKEWIEKKQKSMFIQVDKEFQNCDFQYKGWVK